MNITTVYGIRENNNITFLSLRGAEDYLYENYPEYFTGKDSFINYCENMIWEDVVTVCEGCGEKIIYSDMDADWARGYEDGMYFCNLDCHN